MILVDTSVLVDYLMGIDSRPAVLFEALMVNGVPYGICDFVYDGDFNNMSRVIKDLKIYRVQAWDRSRDCKRRLHSSGLGSTIRINFFVSGH
jgi:hypothetical protein